MKRNDRFVLNLGRHGFGKEIILPSGIEKTELFEKYFKPNLDIT